MPKATDDCTMSSGAMFGRTCRRAIAKRGRPAARAASTYSRDITCSVPERAMRANAGTVAIPIASIAVSVEAPKTAPNMIASKSAGKASSRSLERITSSSAQRGNIPARIPSGVPISAATPTATTPTNSVVRAPHMS